MFKMLLVPIGLLVTACSPPASEPAAKTDMQSMNMSPAAASEAGAIRAVGTVTAVDAAAGTISLNHEPIPAIQWPTMTMQFRAEDASILQGIAVGDRVAFTLKNAQEPQVITMVEKQ
jgi:Cu(I)/Ag(I) efflux system periplasmic protein CusF